MLRIIDKNGFFLRDDFDFDTETEIGLNVTPAQGFYLPKWDGTAWVEGMAQEEIDAIVASATTSEPTDTERITALEATQSDVVDILASALGVTI
jgi:hypothetical protein